MSTSPPFRYGPAHVPRHLSWWVLFGVPALLLAALVLTMREPAIVQAAVQDTYVNCQGASPNYSTIQAAVNDTALEGVVHICPSPSGFYSESVNLAWMNGGVVGDITLRAEHGPGTVFISPTVGPAIYMSSTHDSEEFTADIALIGLNVTSGDNRGIDLAYGGQLGGPLKTISGTVLISDVVANNAGVDGIRVNAWGAVTVFNTEASNNQEDGIDISTYGDVTLTDADAHSNQEDGIDISTEGDVTLTGANANSNQDEGIDISTSGDVTLTDADAHSNLWTGINISTYGDVTLTGANANSNQNEGIYIDAYGDVTLTGTVANSNQDIGINIATLGNVYITNTVANSNAATCVGCPGIVIHDAPGSCPSPLPQVSLDQVTADDNGFGVYVEVSKHDVRLNGLQTNRNYYDGIFVEYYDDDPSCDVGNLHLSNSFADENGLASLEPEGEVGAQFFVVAPVGIRLIAVETITVTNSSAAGNAAAGFCLYSEVGDVVIHDTHAERNGQDGIEFSPECKYYDYDVDVLGEPTPTEQEVRAATLTQPAIQITNTTVISNGDNGIEVEYSNEFESLLLREGEVNSQLLLAARPLTITNVSAISNAENGIAVRLEFYELLTAQATLSEAATLQYPPTTIANSLILGNQQHGVRFRSRVFDYTTPVAQGIQGTEPFTAAAFINGNIICQNNAGGLGILDTVETIAAAVVPEQESLKVDATGNWWGASTGPAHPTNLGGAGNQVVDGDNNGSGEVLFNPWISRIHAGSVVSPTLARLPIALSFQFSDDGNPPSVFLGQGVGNLNDPSPFRLSTSNGVLTGATDSGPNIGQHISADQGWLKAILTPETNGVATVQVEGPCGLVQTLQVPVTSPTLSLQKTTWIDGYGPACPEAREIPPKVPTGTVMKYCYTVTNTSDYTFTTHSLVDDKLGVIFTDLPYILPPGASYSSVQAGVTVTASLTVSTTNVATWTASFVFPPAGVVGADATQTLVDAPTSTSATVNISGPDDDQDGDGIPDNVEGTGDEDNDGIPNFLDPAGPTSLDEAEQPAPRKRLYLPSLPD